MIYILLFIGFILGYFICCLMVISKKSDQASHIYYLQTLLSENGIKYEVE